MNQLPSKLLESAVNEFARLPGIGRKTALRLVLHLLRKPATEVQAFSEALINLRNEVVYCKICHNLSDTEMCSICSNPKRDKNLICIVENIRDVMAIENTQQYQGLYHVLGGIISPINGTGPSDLTVESLLNKVKNNSIKEIILALSATMEGDTTNFYLYRRLSAFPVKVTSIAKGVSIGDELEFTDEITLGRSIINRTIFETAQF